MGNRRFSGTTLLLVVVLVAVLIGVGTIVNPKPPGPPEPPKVTAGSSSASSPEASQMMAMQKQRMKQEMESRKKMYSEHAKIKAARPDPRVDPTQLVVDSKFFQQYSMGNAGAKQLDADIEKAKEERKKNAPPAIKPVTMPPGQ